MRDHDDPVDSVLLAFLDYLEGAAPRPSLEHLNATDRPRAEELLAGLVAGRGIDPRASRPSIEALLAHTPLAGLFPTANRARYGGTDLASIQSVLSDVDVRGRAELDAATGTVVYSYLDFRARLLPVPAATPAVTDEVRAAVVALFVRDPDTSRIGVVATHSEELLTQVLAGADLGAIVLAPLARTVADLPLALAARRMLEDNAPEWPAFGLADVERDVDRAYSEGLDLSSVATDIARRVIEREAARAYRGDKRRAYRALVGQAGLFADLVLSVSRPGSDVDLEAEATRILRAAA